MFIYSRYIYINMYISDLHVVLELNISIYYLNTVINNICYV